MSRRFAYWLPLVLVSLLAGVPGLRAQSPKERNVISLDLMLAQGVEDNIDARGTASGFTEVSPRFQYRQQRRRGSWSLTYQPTIRYYSAFSSRDRLDHRLQFGSTVALTKQWSVDFQSQFVRSTNPFLQVETNPKDPTTVDDVVFGPNRAFVGRERRFTQASAAVTFHYKLDYYSNLHFGANYARADEAGSVFQDRESRNFLATYDRRYARDKSFALSYSLQFFRFAGFDERVRTHSILFTHAYEFVPGTVLSLFAGPQFSAVRTESIIQGPFFFFPIQQRVRIKESTNGLAVGALLTRRVSDRTNLQFSVSQRVAEGGGVLGSNRQRSARLGLSHQLTRRFSTSVGAYLTDHRSLEGRIRGFDFATLGISAGLRYDLSRRVSVDAQYTFSRPSSGSETVRDLLNRNRFSVSLNYSFGRFPVGR